ncbi:MAG: acyltransferase [Bacteroidetes bacterium]|nr:acyltransferase [Bacteroidota bacterium]
MKRVLSYIAPKDKTLDVLLDRERNNFDVIRLLAALSVIFGHSFVLFHASSEEPLRAVLHTDYSGSLAVYVFFFLSGFLVCGSYLRARHALDFLWKRVFRIWPALLVCLLLTVFVVGPWLSTLTVSAYFSQADTWHYLGTNALLYTVTYNLPGVFDTNLVPHTVNGSLWTLPVEVRCYIVMLLLGICRVLRKPLLVLILFAGLAIVYMQKQEWLDYFFTEYGSNLLLFFMAGAVAFLYSRYIVLWPVFSIIFLVLWLLFKDDSGFSQFLFYIFLIYTLLILASNRYVIAVKPGGDYSYGIYIYGFVVQQCFACLFPSLGSYESMIYTMSVTLIIAVLSWFLIEKPALGLVHRFSKPGGQNSVQ